MKKLICLFAAACLLFAVGCGKQTGGGDDDVVAVVTDPPAAEETAAPAEETPAPTAAPIDISDDSAVCFENGVFTSGSFNWNFFFAKTRARINCEIRILNATANGVEDMRLRFSDGSYTLTNGAESVSYNALVGGTYELASGGTADIYILTDDPDMTVENYFGGSIPEGISLGYFAASGRVVYVAYSAK